jgi:hypothetical protein
MAGRVFAEWTGVRTDHQKSLGRMDSKRPNCLGVHNVYSSQYIHNTCLVKRSERLLFSAFETGLGCW